MNRPLTPGYGQSIVVSLIILSVLYNGIQVAHAEQLHDDLISSIVYDSRNTIVHLSKSNNTSNLSAQRHAQTDKQVRCLALNIYFEARGESEQGQHAVGHVVMNRVANQHFPDTICEVVQQGGEQQLHRCQFSWWCDGRSDKPLNQAAWRNAMQSAYAIYFRYSKDPTDGALWYHAAYVNPYWSNTLTMGTKIGQHVFYLQKKSPKYALNQ